MRRLHGEGRQEIRRGPRAAWKERCRPEERAAAGAGATHGCWKAVFRRGDHARRRDDGHASWRHHGEESRATKRAGTDPVELLRDEQRPLTEVTMRRFLVALGIALSASGAWAQAAPQTESDAYTRYELLAPGSAKFRIVYEVTATTPGATYYFNPIRKGSVASNESVFDRATGKPLVFDEVGLDVARAGGVRSNDTSQKYIRVTLARPV